MNKDKGKAYIKANSGMFNYALRKWKLLLGVAIVTGILSVVFSGPSFIQPKYTSTAIIYPTNLGEYGNETPVEQLQQYLQSDKIRHRIIEKYDLHKEYEIEPDYPKAPAYMKLMFEKHFEIKETRFQSIELSVSSTNPQKAKKMADKVLALVNEIIYNEQKVKLKTVMLIEKDKMNTMKAKLDSLENIIRTNGEKYGILDFSEQTAELMEGYMQFLLQGKKGANFKKVEKLYENMQKYGHQVEIANKLIEKLNEVYAEQVSDYSDALAVYKKKKEYTYVLVSPEVPTLKSYPIRWLIAIAAVFSACLFTFVLLLIFGSRKNK